MKIIAKGRPADAELSIDESGLTISGNGDDLRVTDAEQLSAAVMILSTKQGCSFLVKKTRHGYPVPREFFQAVMTAFGARRFVAQELRQVFKTGVAMPVIMFALTAFNVGSSARFGGAGVALLCLSFCHLLVVIIGAKRPQVALLGGLAGANLGYAALLGWLGVRTGSWLCYGLAAFMVIAFFGMERKRRFLAEIERFEPTGVHVAG